MFNYVTPSIAPQVVPWFARFPCRPEHLRDSLPRPNGEEWWMNPTERWAFLRFAEAQFAGEIMMWQVQWADWLASDREAVKGRELRESTIEFVEKFGAFMTRSFRCRYWTRKEGYCYLRMFEPQHWTAMHTLLGESPNNNLLALLSPLWRHDMDGLEIYQSGPGRAHCQWHRPLAISYIKLVHDPTYPHFGLLGEAHLDERRRPLADRSTFMRHLLWWEEIFVRSSRPAAKGKGWALAKGKGRAEGPKLKMLSNSAILLNIMRKQNKARISKALDESMAQ